MDTVSLLSEIIILKRYIEWLETSLASYEPDWICDKMGDKDLCHDWCYDNCGTEAWTHDCFKKYYENFAADRKTEPTSSKMEQVDKDINVRSKTENSSEKPNNCEHITEDGVTCAKYPACDGCLDNPLNKVKGSERLVKGKEQTDLVEDSPSLVKDLVKAFCEDGTWLERQRVYTLTLAEAKQRAVDIIESVTQTETQNSNLTFEKADEPQTDEEYINNLPWTEVGNGEQTDCPWK